MNIQNIIKLAIAAARSVAPTYAKAFNSVAAHAVIIEIGPRQRIKVLADECILGETTTYIGTKRDFRVLALAKAELSLRTRMDTRQVLQRAPLMLRAGDCIFGGGVFCQEYAIGVSGLPQELDEVIARLMATTMIAAVQFDVRNHQSDGDSFLPRNFGE